MEGPIVETQAGKLRGFISRTVLGNEYWAFKGIPFAEPPVGQLRFQDPRRAEPWTGVREASEHGPTCGQLNMMTRIIEGSDDCLYLNVYARPWKREAQRAVMIWIHGGGFVNGSGDDYFYSPDYILRKDVVCVTINYRLGVLGFLNLEDEIAPGNQGLKDQVMALQWVRENISNFGGDPKNVTIFGESAGAASVHYLCLSPLAKGLFHKGIVQSGVALNSWARQTQPREFAYRFCELLGLKTRNHKEIVDHLKTIEVTKLIEAQEKLLTKLEKMQFTFPFGPGVDAKSANPFMPIDVEEAARNGVHVPLIIGHTSREGATLLSFFGDDLDLYNTDFAKCVHPLALDFMKKKYNLSPDDIRRYYCKNEKISQDRIDCLVDVSSDLYFVEGIQRVIKIQAERSSTPTYMYQLSYDREVSPSKIFFGATHVKGAGHADDLQFLFYGKLLAKMSVEPLKRGSERFKIMEQMTDMWTNFAITGKPTPCLTESMPFYWLPINAGTILRYLNIDEDARMDVALNLEQSYNSYKLTRNKL